MKVNPKFGTRRQYRCNRGKLGPIYSLDFETRSFVGFDPGRKDEGAMVITTRLPSGRILYTPIKPPTKEEVDSMLADFRRVFPVVRQPNFQQLRPPLSEEQKAMRNVIWEAMRRSLGLETAENSDKADSG